MTTGTNLGANPAYKRYVWETFILDGSAATKDASGVTVALAGAPVDSPITGTQAVAHVPAHNGIAAVLGTAGQVVTLEPFYRSMYWFFTSQSASGGFGYENAIPYSVTMGGDRGDPAQDFSIHDDGSVWVSEVNIEAVDGAVIYVKVQREVE